MYYRILCVDMYTMMNKLTNMCVYCNFWHKKSYNIKLAYGLNGIVSRQSNYNQMNEEWDGKGYLWWCHQMEACSAWLDICAGNSPLTSEFPSQRPVTRSFDVFFDLRLNKRLSEQSWGWWFVTPLRPLWRHSNGKRCSLPVCRKEKLHFLSFVWG